MDDELARRLFALRHSLELPTAPQTPMAPTKKLVDKEDLLVERFQNVFNQQPMSRLGRASSKKEVPEKNHEEEPSLQELLDILSLERETQAIERVDETEAIELLSEAKLVISSAEFSALKERKSETTETFLNLIGEDTLAVFERDTDYEDNILRMIQDEIDFETAHGITSGADYERESEKPEAPRDQRRRGSGLDEDLLERFEALGGLELPPVPKIEPGADSSLTFSSPTIGNEETDTWCCICNEDAEYQCSGCENDIYCASCLFEAHTGPNAGYEERRHKWAKYTKSKKVATF